MPKRRPRRAPVSATRARDAKGGHARWRGGATPRRTSRARGRGKGDRGGRRRASTPPNSAARTNLDIRGVAPEPAPLLPAGELLPPPYIFSAIANVIASSFWYDVADLREVGLLLEQPPQLARERPRVLEHLRVDEVGVALERRLGRVEERLGLVAELGELAPQLVGVLEALAPR